jgi:hypothetical protein
LRAVTCVPDSLNISSWTAPLHHGQADRV